MGVPGLIHAPFDRFLGGTYGSGIRAAVEAVLEQDERNRKRKDEQGPKVEAQALCDFARTLKSCRVCHIHLLLPQS